MDVAENALSKSRITRQPNPSLERTPARREFMVAVAERRC